MKVLVVGDLHFQPNNVYLAKKVREEIQKVCREECPDFVVLMGDLLHTHERVYLTPYCEVISLVQSLLELSPVVLLIGNHDRPSNQEFLSEKHPFVALKKWSNCTVVDTVIEAKNKDGERLLFVPYVYPGRFREALKSVQELGSVRLIFCHQEFMGAKYGGVVSTRGDVWGEELPFVVSGHIHDYQVLQSNLLYVGAAFQQLHCESREKGVVIVETNGRETLHRLVRLELPLKVSLRLSAKELLEDRQNYDGVSVVVVEGGEEVKSLVDSTVVKRMKEMGVRVRFKCLKAGQKGTINFLPSRPSTSFRGALEEKVKGSRLREWFQLLFD